MYQSIDKEKSKTKGLALGAAAASLLFGSAYFLYSGAYGVQTPLHSFFANEEQAQSIRIEYYMDDMPIDVKPNTPQWTAYHNGLMIEAGYDAEALRANPNADVAFIAYDSREEEEERTDILHAEFENQPMRKSFGITCYTMYSEVGDTANQKCEPTKTIKKPIRTGCSSLGSGSDIMGTAAFGDLACKSKSENERVSARCCQPTPDTRYKRSAFAVAVVSQEEGDGKCTSISCPNADDVLVGCGGSTSATGFGGAQVSVGGDDVCKVQAQGGGMDGKVSADALCAAQPTRGNYNLLCRSYMSGGSIATSDGFSSSIQCPKGKVMFDCTSFIQRRMEECDADKSFLLHEDGGMDTSNDVLNGEYYFKESRASKVFCEGVGDSDKVRVQATCCQFLKNKGPQSEEDEE